MKAVRLEGVGPGPDDLLARWFESSYASLVKAMKARMSKWILYAKWRTRTLSGICILAIARKRAAPEYNRRTVGGETMDREGEPGEVAARTSNAQAVAMMRSGTRGFLRTALALLASLAMAPSLHAAEGGASFYLLGSRGPMAGFTPPPGVFFQNDFYERRQHVRRAVVERHDLV